LRVAVVMSGGTEGGMAPHWTIFERADDTGASGPALAIGRAHTAALPAEHLGRMAQVDAVAAGIGMAMADAGIDDAGDVHFVQVKCPLLTVARTAEAEARGANVATRDTLKSMGLSRAASALGVAVALDEIAPSRLSDADIGSRWDWFSARASCSAGVELLVSGNPIWPSFGKSLRYFKQIGKGSKRDMPSESTRPSQLVRSLWAMSSRKNMSDISAG